MNLLDRAKVFPFVDLQDIDNFLLDTGMDPVLAADLGLSSLRSTHIMPVCSQASVSDPNTIQGIMNGVIKKKLKIIPEDLM